LALHCVFIDLEKVYDRVPMEELWECMQLAGTSERYVEVVMYMYDKAKTAVEQEQRSRSNR